MVKGQKSLASLRPLLRNSNIPVPIRVRVLCSMLQPAMLAADPAPEPASCDCTGGGTAPGSSCASALDAPLDADPALLSGRTAEAGSSASDAGVAVAVVPCACEEAPCACACE